MLTASQATSDDVSDALSSLDQQITLIEQMPAVPMNTSVAVQLFSSVIQVSDIVQGVGLDMLNDERNRFVTDEINRALSDIRRPANALVAVGPVIQKAVKASAPTVLVPGYRRLLGDVLKASRRALDSLNALVSFRPWWIKAVLPFARTSDAIVGALKKFQGDVEAAARDEVKKQSLEPQKQASEATDWVKIGAWFSIAASAIALTAYLKKKYGKKKRR